MSATISPAQISGIRRRLSHTGDYAYMPASDVADLLAALEWALVLDEGGPGLVGDEWDKAVGSIAPLLAALREPLS